jgi:type II secretory ATPase GspE/PulE/Tfp pilus assembly ATPase PilB-like protein
MVTMQRDGMLKVKDGITTASEVIRSVLAIS